MKYDVGQFVVFTAQPDGGIWEGAVAEIAEFEGTMYRIKPLVNPIGRSYTLGIKLTRHLFSDMWIYHDKSSLLNLLLERS